MSENHGTPSILTLVEKTPIPVGFNLPAGFPLKSFKTPTHIEDLYDHLNLLVSAVESHFTSQSPSVDPNDPNDSDKIQTRMNFLLAKELVLTHGSLSIIQGLGTQGPAHTLAIKYLNESNNPEGIKLLRDTTNSLKGFLKSEPGEVVDITTGKFVAALAN